MKSTTIASFPSNVCSMSQKADESLSGPQKDSTQFATPKTKSSPTPEILSSAVTTEIVPCHVVVSAETEQTETIARSVAVDTLGKNQEESKSITKPSRLTENRNVVIAETTNSSNRKVAQEASNRIVVSSNTINSSERINNDNDSDIDLDELVKQGDEIKKSKIFLSRRRKCFIWFLFSEFFN